MTDCEKETMRTFQQDLAAMLDRYTHESLQGTHDYVMAKFVRECIKSLAAARNSLHDQPVEDTGTLFQDLPLHGEYDHEHRLWTKAQNHTQGQAKCRDCGLDIRWQKCNTSRGMKNMPFDTEIVRHGDREFVTSHWDTCPGENEEPDEDETDGEDKPYEDLAGVDDTPF